MEGHVLSYCEIAKFEHTAYGFYHCIVQGYRTVPYKAESDISRVGPTIAHPNKYVSYYGFI